MHAWGRVVVVVALVAVAFVVAKAVRSPNVGPAVVVAATTGRVDTSTMRASPNATPQRKENIVVAFRLDRDITSGHYLGERWVSPPTFAFAQPGRQYVAHAKLQSIADDGSRVDLSGDWSTDDPQMIAISRDQPGQVTIVVREAGEGELVASAGGQRKVLQVRAIRHPDAMEVAIAQ
jgi:hypothetical protein